MDDMSFKKNRKPNRLKGYDYSKNGYYFVTICTKNRICFFGEIVDEKMILNEYRKCVYDFWKQIPKFYKNVFLDEFIIMPNHIHGVVVIDNVGTEHCSVPTETVMEKTNLSQIIKSFKEICIKPICKKYNNFDFAWQRSFYDHIIKDEQSLLNIQNYIINNPI